MIYIFITYNSMWKVYRESIKERKDKTLPHVNRYFAKK